VMKLLVEIVGNPSPACRRFLFFNCTTGGERWQQCWREFGRNFGRRVVLARIICFDS
jgi:hypothetical protein